MECILTNKQVLELSKAVEMISKLDSELFKNLPDFNGITLPTIDKTNVDRLLEKLKQ